jgi:hypothetical protein
MMGGRGLYVISVTTRIESINFKRAVMRFRVIPKYELRVVITAAIAFVVVTTKTTMYLRASQPQDVNHRIAKKATCEEFKEYG